MLHAPRHYEMVQLVVQWLLVHLTFWVHLFASLTQAILHAQVGLVPWLKMLVHLWLL